MTTNPFVKPLPGGDAPMENPFTTTAPCPKCDGELGEERYSLHYLGEPITFCSRKCMNRWGFDNIPGWQRM